MAEHDNFDDEVCHNFNQIFIDVGWYTSAVATSYIAVDSNTNWFMLTAKLTHMPKALKYSESFALPAEDSWSHTYTHTHINIP